MTRDIVAGLALVVAGGVFSLYSALELPLGTVRQMGAGMFPMALGVLLAVLGVCIAATGLVDRQPLPRIEPRALTAVTAAVVAFALLIRTGGLVPAIVAATVLTSLAVPGRRVVLVLALCATMVALTWMIFVVLLNISIPVFRWSF